MMRQGLWIGIGLTALAVLFPSGAQAAIPPATGLCIPSRVAAIGAPQPASTRLLIDKATSAEAILTDVVGDADAALALLDADATTGAGADNLALARYCSAAGEAMRRSSIGSQERAQSWLRAALRHAELAGDGEVAATASWRLALAIFGGPAPARGGTRGSGEDDEAEEAARVETVRQECAAATSPAALRDDRPGTGRLAMRCAFSRAQAAGLHELAARVGLRLARNWLALANLANADAELFREEARSQALTALASAARTSEPLRGALLASLSAVAVDSGGADDPRLSDALGLILIDAPSAPATLALQARLALARDDMDRAAGLLRRAIFAEAQSPRAIHLSDYYLLLARADPANASAHVEQAYRALEQVRPLLPRSDPLTEEPTFDLALRPVFERAVDIQLAGASGEDMRRIAAAQTIAEAYRQAELQNALGPDCVPARQPVRPVDLKPGEILFYPLLLGDRIELIYARADGGYRRLTPNRGADRARVTALAAAMTRSMSRGDGNEQWRGPARALYDLLIAPLADQLGPDSTLIIVPDGPLRGIAFGALIDGDGHYLIEKSQIAIVPALSYAQPGSGNRGMPSVVAASLALPMDLPAGTFAKLDGTAEEAQLAASGGGRLIADFRKADLEHALSRQRVDVLHLATHAAFNGRSDRSFIVANGESISLPDLRAMLARNRARGDTLALLILSACETAVGDNDEGMGLAGAAVEAGAQSAIASFWQVSDFGTLELMKGFYAAYRGGEGRADALRSAQLAMIRSGDPDLSDPNIWAAFALLGSWR